MPFTNKDFPGHHFESFDEYDEARKGRSQIETVLEERAKREDDEVVVTKVTATVVPAPRDLLERKVSDLELKVSSLIDMLRDTLPTLSKHNKEGLLTGTILQGESKGVGHTLEVLPGEEGYLCSDGQIYESLSGAALGVSGNRRSGWKFWTDIEGTPVGVVTGRFKKNAGNNPFDPERVQSMRVG
ncbi:MAG: hypothetical protein DRI24_22350 [Deltaproteobacteria bacterium]|nr:MAG: hypothetical protein DRI24_22350 [Deltaproteobacteria bacterium]